MAKKQRKLSKVKKAVVSILSILLSILLVFAVVELFYYPHYLIHRKAVETSAGNTTEISIVSANVRTFSPTDFFKKSWFYRADLLTKTVMTNSPDIIGFQEVTKMHYRYLTKVLPGYDNIITYRDKSLMPEGCPIFFRSDRFHLIDKGSFWLSETPEKMSKDWGSMCYRICSYAILENNADNQRFVVFNTHLDHVSDEARIKGIQVVLDKINQFGSLPGIIMGDFNATEDSETYRAATENFNDAKYQTKNTQKGATFQNFGAALDSQNIDYFMISKTGIQVKEYKILTETYNDVYPSDHFPISLKISLSKQ
ncbi:MAG: endonuclease/exonuclease/phosphatase family protein [Clostridia bacterium]|nr:endonuclease/exonuclease/phosphatase family protein [Clostridia bacterium]